MHTTLPLKRRDVLVFVLIFLVAAALRVQLVTRHNFPIGDGGFFYQSIVDLQANDYILPPTLTYNRSEIENVYPPVAFYLIGLLADTTSWDLITILRWYPVITSLATILLVFAFYRRFFTASHQVLLATALFTLIPTTFTNTLGGSGVVRATGMFFGIGTLYIGHSLILTEKRRYIYLTAFMLALTFMTQPQWGVFALVSLLVLGLTKSLLLGPKLAQVVVITLLLCVGWILYLGVYHAFWQIFSAVLFSQFGDAPLRFTVGPLFISGLGFTNEPMFNLLAAIGLLGLFVSFAVNRRDITLWLLAILFFPFSEEITFVMPLAAIATVTIDYLIIKGIASFRTPTRYDPNTREVIERGSNWAVWVSYICTAFIILFSVANAVRIQNVPVLARQEIQAMRWIDEQIPEESQFLVITGLVDWRDDVVNEWFPTLANRESLTTVRATEWGRNSAYEETVNLHAAIQNCVGRNLACISTAFPSMNDSIYLYVSPSVGGRLRPNLLANPAYERILPELDEQVRPDSVLIFRRIG